MAIAFAALRRPMAVWLALLLAWFGALAPSVSHALALTRGAAAAGQEICTSPGPRWETSVPAAALSIKGPADSLTDSPAAPPSVFSLDHCPFCLLFANRGVPASHAVVHHFVVLGEHEEPTVRPAFFYFLRYILAAPARGPPVFS